MENEKLGRRCTRNGYEEQMISSIGSRSTECDPARDALETSEDATYLRRFKILNLVGTGNYARVYRVVSSKGRELAVKAINLSKTSENYRTKFLPRELTILKRIKHINICKTHEILQVADRIFIVMQFCSRGTIADLLHKLGPLSESVTRNLFIQTVEAVCYMHSIDLAHRDLKIENILLDQDFCPKLTDFSYSTFLTEKTTSAKNQPKSGSLKQLKTINQFRPASPTSPTNLSDTFCGTLPYLSPEMIRQNPYDSKKTDIWSLGVCLFVILNDKLPFPFEDIKMMIRKQLSRDYKFRANADYTESIRNLVGSMLEPDFTRRLNIQGVSRHPWMDGVREKPSI